MFFGKDTRTSGVLRVKGHVQIITGTGDVGKFLQTASVMVVIGVILVITWSMVNGIELILFPMKRITISCIHHAVFTQLSH